MTYVKTHRFALVIASFALFTILATACSLFASTGAAQVSFVGDPIAAAYVKADGTITAGTSSVADAFYDSAAGQYEITINGEDYFYSDYVSLVTLSDDGPLVVSTSSVNGHLVVIIIDQQGNHVQADFQFVTFAP